MTASILIPAFNAEQTLASTLESCVLQGAEYVQEIIVVDDHSTDGTQAVFEAVAEAHPEFQWTWSTNPGKGACSARNHAFDLSRGAWIQWLDADDLLGLNKLKTQLTLLNKHQAELVNSPFKFFAGNQITGIIPDTREWDFELINDPADWLSRDIMIGTHCWLTSRQLAVAAGPWDIQLKTNQDGEYFCRVIAKSDSVLFDSNSIAFYRREGGGVSRFTSDKADSLFRSIQSMEAVALALEDSPRMQQMVSNRYQTFIYTAYPTRPDLIQQATDRLRALPPPTISNPNAVSRMVVHDNDFFDPFHPLEYTAF